MAKKKTKSKAVKCTVTVVDAVTDPKSGEVKVSRRKVETRLKPKPRPADLRKPFYTVSYIAHKTGVHRETTNRDLYRGEITRVLDVDNNTNLIPQSSGKPYIADRVKRSSQSARARESSDTLMGLSKELRVRHQVVHHLAQKMGFGRLVGDKSVGDAMVFTEKEADRLRSMVEGRRLFAEEFISTGKAASELGFNTATVGAWIRKGSVDDEETGVRMATDIPLVDYPQKSTRFHLPRRLLAREKKKRTWGVAAKKVKPAQAPETPQLPAVQPPPTSPAAEADQTEAAEFAVRVSKLARRIRAPEEDLKLIAGLRLPLAIDIAETILSQRVDIGDEAATARMFFGALARLDRDSQTVLFDHALKIPADLRHNVFWRIAQPLPKLPRERVLEMISEGNYNLRP